MFHKPKPETLRRHAEERAIAQRAATIDLAKRMYRNYLRDIDEPDDYAWIMWGERCLRYCDGIPELAGIALRLTAKT